MPEQELSALVEAARPRIISFARRLIGTPSLSGQEQAAAELVLAEMRALDFDQAWADAAGNVIGMISGGPGATTMLHAHLDVVDPGDPGEWQHPPFSGALDRGHIWGRGASDDKGCVASQVYAAGLIHQAGLRPAGDVCVVAAVNEESSGLGTRVLVRDSLANIDPAVVIVGEPSGNTLRRGHRGRFEFVITWRGRAAHASAPELGRNPHYSMARFLLALRDAPMAVEPVFGGSSVSPTLSYLDQTGTNVIPATLTLHIDWRNAPGETTDDALAFLQRLVEETVERDISASVVVRSREMRSYTGLPLVVRNDAGGFLRDEDDPLLLRAKGILEGVLKRTMPIDVWHFCTDGGTLSAAGLPCLGFGPGDEKLAHVLDERLDVEELMEATLGYMGLALQMGA